MPCMCLAASRCDVLCVDFVSLHVCCKLVISLWMRECSVCWLCEFASLLQVDYFGVHESAVSVWIVSFVLCLLCVLGCMWLRFDSFWLLTCDDCLHMFFCKFCLVRTGRDADGRGRRDRYECVNRKRCGRIVDTVGSVTV